MSGCHFISILRKVAVFCLLAGCLNSDLARAQTSNWTGNAPDNSWDQSNNWLSGGFPGFPGTPVPGSTLVFAVPGSSRPVTENNFTAGSAYNLAFDTGTTAFTLNGNQITLADAFGSAGSISFTGNPGVAVTHTINLNMGLNNAGATIATSANGSILINGAISGNGGITKASSGTLSLTGANSYLGNTSITGGTLELGNGGTGGTLSTNSAISVGNGAIFSVNQSDTVVQGTDFSGAAITGAGGFTQAGSGTTILTAANAYTGATSITGGTLQLGNGGAAGSLATASAIDIGLGSTFRINQTDIVTQGTDFSGAAITGDGGFNQAGSGRTILTANNTYTGATSITGGTLQLGNGTAVGSLSTSSAISISNGATFRINQSDTVIQGIDFSGAAITGGGGLRLAGVGLTLTAANTYTGTTHVAAGTLQLGNGGTTGSLATGSAIFVDTTGTFAVNQSDTVIQGTDFSGAAIAGLGGFNQAGTGTTVLNANNSYRGTTTVSAGTLNIQHANALGDTIGSTSVSTGATLAIQGGITTEAESLGLSGNGVSNGGALQNVSGNNTYAGAITLNADSRINSIAGTLTLDVASGNAITGSNTNVTFGGAGDIVVADAIATGNGSLTKDGAGNLTLTGSNTYSGATSVTGGELQVGNNGTTGSIANTSSINIGTGSSLIVSRSDSVTQSAVLGNGAISGAGSLTKSGSGTLILTANNSYTGGTTVSEGTLVINGNQSAATGSIQVESGAILTGSGSYGGSVADTLTVNGTLTGTGTITGNTIINGIHSPGNSPGLQTFNGNLSYSTGSSLNWELIANSSSGRGTNYDAIDVGGNLTFTGATSMNLLFNGAGSTVNWNDAFWGSDKSWLIYDLGGSTTGFGLFTISGTNWLDSFNNSLGSVRSGASFTLDQSGNDIILRFDEGISSVPEPGSLALMSVVGLFGGGRLVQRYIRRRKNPESSAC